MSTNDSLEEAPAPDQDTAPRHRFGLLFVAPTLLLLAVVVLPLAGGWQTLFLRDVLNTHFPMKASQAEALGAGSFPLLDPYRAGGQPLAGNPNAVPFYPDNVLYLVASPLWAMNAHFWLHLLLAPFAVYWLARVWGLGREAAWTAGVVYAWSGFFLSHLSFYNLVAGAALAPALVAACLAAGPGTAPGRSDRRRWWPTPVAGVLWALLLLSGDPLMALLAFVLAAAAVIARAGLRPWRGLPRRTALGPLALAFTGGTLLAAPQILEMGRILELSYRGHRGFVEGAAGIASFDPRQAVEWLLPLVFGRPDVVGPGSFWGEAYYTGFPPYYFSLYPGLLALALVVAGAWSRGAPASSEAASPPLASTPGAPPPDPGRRPLRRWAWILVAAGIFFALGRFNPVAAWFFEGVGAGLLRYPVKTWMLVALPASLLAALGAEQLLAGRRRRVLAVISGAGLVLLALWLAATLAPAPVEALLRTWMPASRDAAFAVAERTRFLATTSTSILLAALLLLLLVLLRHRPRRALAALLVVHAGGQLALLAPLLATDSAAPYRTPPPTLEHLADGARIAHNGFNHAFGSSGLLHGEYPQPEMRWLARRSFFELYPSTAPLWGHPYELNVSPEGLDAFLTRMAEATVEHSEDAVRLRLLRVWGVDTVILHRELAPEALAVVQRVDRVPSFGAWMFLYHLRQPAPEATFAGNVLRAPHMNAAYTMLSEPGFDPATTAVLAGAGPPRGGAGGSARIVRSAPEEVEVAVSATSAGVLVLQRSHLELWRASVDGEETPTVAANLYRLGVEVPAGEHRVRLWVDRRPLAWGAALSLAGLVLLLGLSLALSRRFAAAPQGHG